MSASIIKKLNEITVLHARFSGEALRSRGNKKIKTEDFRSSPGHC